MNAEGLRTFGHQAVDWVADYFQSIEDLPVKSQVKPGDIASQLAPTPPEKGEGLDTLIGDVNDIVLPGITHWQHPNFHAYFPGNSSVPSFVAEILTAGLGAQCMVWETSPAAAELEEHVMNWLKQLMALPKDWHGVIQDTASTGTLVALLTAREQMTGFQVNEEGFEGRRLRIYCSSETHSSIDKAVRIAGFGSNNLVKIPVDPEHGMIPAELRAHIEADLAAGYQPCAVVGASGTTGALGFDPLAELAVICKEYGIWFHVDAAYAGSALILEEERHLMKGLEAADSFVFNPHKWLFTNFDCAAYYVRDKEALLRTFEILPEYLKTKTRGTVNDYRDWGIQLGRRFRALKLWFVIRYYGAEGLRAKLRQHIEWTQWVEQQIKLSDEFELLMTRRLNMAVFHVKAAPQDVLTERLLQDINASGKAYLSHTKVAGSYAIRLVLGQTNLTFEHVEKVWKLLGEHLVQLATPSPS
ncbi:MAG: aminotransferase class V-fold PLP-dependent enzyme [Bacteroidota bacterium]